MIDDAMRDALLGQFPAEIPVAAFAHGTTYYETRARVEPRLRSVSLDPHRHAAVPAGVGHLILDGLDLLVDPAAALRTLRVAARGLRAFALVSNAVYARALAGFIDGTRRGPWRPLVKGDLAPLFTANGWLVHDIGAIPDVGLIRPTLPHVIVIGGVHVQVTTAEERERLVTAGYLVIADAA